MRANRFRVALSSLVRFPVSFGEDAAGSLYIAYLGSGEVYRMQTAVPEPAAAALVALAAPVSLTRRRTRAPAFKP